MQNSYGNMAEKPPEAKRTYSELEAEITSLQGIIENLAKLVNVSDEENDKMRKFLNTVYCGIRDFKIDIPK